MTTTPTTAQTTCEIADAMIVVLEKVVAAKRHYGGADNMKKETAFHFTAEEIDAVVATYRFLSTDRSGRRELAERVREECAKVALGDVTFEQIGKTQYANIHASIAAAIRSMPLFPTSDEAGGWRGIASAPKDGTYIIVSHPSGFINIMQWCIDQHWRPGVDSSWKEWDLTHWQPLPLHPARRGKGDAI